MRKLKRLFKNLKMLYSNRNKIKNIQKTVQKELGNITFKFASFGGADINYFILKNNHIFAMMRLAILDKEDTSLPIIRFNKKKRLDKEYHAYTIGSKYNLTPKVIYHSEDVIVCEYLDGQRLYDILNQDKSKVWDILSEAIVIYKKLHDIGIVHLDATLKNFIVDNHQMKVIDFEYYPSNEFSVEAQKAYDYVRIIEYTLRMIPQEYQNDYESFINVLDEVVSDELRNVDFTLVERWLKNIEMYPIHNILRKKIFNTLVFDNVD
jgi:tRNA A-37 threonylcarbamoyl transferase component Bud32